MITAYDTPMAQESQFRAQAVVGITLQMSRAPQHHDHTDHLARRLHLRVGRLFM